MQVDLVRFSDADALAWAAGELGVKEAWQVKDAREAGETGKKGDKRGGQVFFFRKPDERRMQSLRETGNRVAVGLEDMRGVQTALQGKADFVFFSQAEHAKLDWQSAKGLAGEKVVLVFELAEFLRLEPHALALHLERARKTARVACKANLPVWVASGAREKYELRRTGELKHFLFLLGWTREEVGENEKRLQESWGKGA